MERENWTCIMRWKYILQQRENKVKLNGKWPRKKVSILKGRKLNIHQLDCSIYCSDSIYQFQISCKTFKTQGHVSLSYHIIHLLQFEIFIS